MNSEKEIITVALGAALLFQELSKNSVRISLPHTNQSQADVEITSLKSVCLEPRLNSKYLTIRCLSIVVPQNILEHEKQLMLTML